MTKAHPPAPSAQHGSTIGARWRWIVFAGGTFESWAEACDWYYRYLERPPDRINFSDGLWWLGWISKQEGRALDAKLKQGQIDIF